MPELPEVAAYGEWLRASGLGRRIATVETPDAWYLKGGADRSALVAALVGATLVAVRRHGKLLMVGTDPPGPVIGLRFGMTGRLVIDGRGAVDRLLYAPSARDRRWDRFALRFADGGALCMEDPRRLGGVVLDPDEGALGPDALTAGLPGITAALAGSSTSLKARLMDQSRLAGIGNLCADEILWRAGLSPLRPAGGLDAQERRALARTVGTTLRMLIRRGGSHTGDLMPARRPGGLCPRDGHPLTRSRACGRTTWWCAHHQH